MFVCDCLKGCHERALQVGRQRGSRLDYRKLQELRSKEPLEMAASLLQYRESFEMLVKAEHIKEDWMTLLVEILGKMCHTHFTQNLIEVMSICKGSAFMCTHLPKYILNLPLIQEEMETESEFGVLVECLVTFFKEWLVRFPRSFPSDVPIDHFGGILKEIDVKGKEEFRKEVETLLAKRRELVKEERKIAQVLKRAERQEVEPHPPVDFKEISIYPNEKELRSEEKPFLRRNKTEKYEDLNHYLDVQFRLLREDFVAPLREGVREITKKIPKEDRSQDFYFYENVEIMNTVCTRAGIVHCVHLDMRSLQKIPWEHSKRLAFGSFLCLSKDNFKTMLFATVANRKPEDLKSGRLDIRFVDGFEATQRTRDGYVMVESAAYFEAYRHILQQLKQITPESFPFQEYLVHCNTDVKPPQYLRSAKSRGQVQYDLRETLGMPDVHAANKVSICDHQSWPYADDVNLNVSQLKSLKGALTKEFSVIQGPPGTGTITLLLT